MAKKRDVLSEVDKKIASGKKREATKLANKMAGPELGVSPKPKPQALPPPPSTRPIVAAKAPPGGEPPWKGAPVDKSRVDIPSRKGQAPTQLSELAPGSGSAARPAGTQHVSQAFEKQYLKRLRGLKAAFGASISVLGSAWIMHDLMAPIMGMPDPQTRDIEGAFANAWGTITKSLTSAFPEKDRDKIKKKYVQSVPKIYDGDSIKILMGRLQSYARHANGATEHLKLSVSPGTMAINAIAEVRNQGEKSQRTAREEKAHSDVLEEETSQPRKRGSWQVDMPREEKLKIQRAERKAKGEERRQKQLAARDGPVASIPADREIPTGDATRGTRKAAAAAQPLAPRGRQDLDRQGTSTGYPERKKDTILGPGAGTRRDPKPSFTKRPDISDAQKMATSIMVPKNVRAKKGEGEIWHSPDQDILDERGSKPSKLITPLAYRQDVSPEALDPAEESLKGMKSQTGGSTTPQTGGGTTQTKRRVIKPASVQKRISPLQDLPPASQTEESFAKKTAREKQASKLGGDQGMYRSMNRARGEMVGPDLVRKPPQTEKARSQKTVSPKRKTVSSLPRESWAVLGEEGTGYEMPRRKKSDLEKDFYVQNLAAKSRAEDKRRADNVQATKEADEDLGLKPVSSDKLKASGPPIDIRERPMASRGRDMAGDFPPPKLVSSPAERTARGAKLKSPAPLSEQIKPGVRIADAMAGVEKKDKASLLKRDMDKSKRVRKSDALRKKDYVESGKPWLGAKPEDEAEWERMQREAEMLGQRKGGKIKKKKATKAPAKKQYSTSHRARPKNPTISKTSYNY